MSGAFAGVLVPWEATDPEPAAAPPLFARQIFGNVIATTGLSSGFGFSVPHQLHNQSPELNAICLKEELEWLLIS